MDEIELLPVAILLRVPPDLRDRIDARCEQIGESSRNAWLNRVIEWALAQPVKVDKTEVRT